MAIQLNRNAYTDYEFITIPSGSQYDITNNLTLMIWVRLDSFDSQIPPTQTTFLSRNDMYNLQYWGDKFQMSWCYSTMPSQWHNVFFNPYSPSIGVWYHLTGTFANKNQKCYVNGVLGKNFNLNDTIQSSVGQTVTIGSKVSVDPLGYSHVAGFGQETLADARIYNRVLSAQEISTAYSCHGHDGIINGLVGRWPLNDEMGGMSTSGDTIHDLSLYKNNGDSTSYGSSTGPYWDNSAPLSFRKMPI